MGIHRIMSNFFEDCRLGRYMFLYRHTAPILLLILGAKYEPKSEPLPLGYTTQGAIVTTRITQ